MIRPGFHLRTLAFMLLLALGVKVLLDAAGDGFVRAAFQSFPAKTAAAYWGVPLDALTLSYEAQGVMIEVTRACAATDFFSMAFALLAFSRYRWFSPLLAWLVTLAANAIRLVLLVPVDAVFPKEEAPIVHLTAGVAVFLPALISIWYVSHGRVRAPRGPHKEASHG